MNQQLIRPDRFFFGTRSLPCPYLEGKTERKVVTDLAGPKADELYERLSRAGFRRSHSLAYRPACPDCSACVPVRIAVSEFQWTNLRRVARTNSDLTADDIEAIATVEQPPFRPINASAMKEERQDGFQRLPGYDRDTPVSSRTKNSWFDGRLAAVMLMDRMGPIRCLQLFRRRRHGEASEPADPVDDRWRRRSSIYISATGSMDQTRWPIRLVSTAGILGQDGWTAMFTVYVYAQYPLRVNDVKITGSLKPINLNTRRHIAKRDGFGNAATARSSAI